MTDQQQVAIVFTGRQGAGKSVLSRALKNALQGAGIKVRSSNGPHPNYEDTLIVETTHDQRCYLSTGAQVSLGVGRLDVEPTPAERTDEQTIASIHSIIAQYEDQPDEIRGDVQAQTALQAIAALTEKFLPEQHVRTQEAFGRAVDDFAKATGKTVVALFGEDAEKWTAARHPRARVDPQYNPNRRTYVSKVPSGGYWPVKSDSTIVPPSHVENYRYFMTGGLHALCGLTHAASLNAGWYTNPATGERLERNVPEMMMLIVSEIAEAMEGYRKGLMDDHLPDRLSVEVELADAVIRIGDLCGFLGLDLAGAVIEKMAYNAKREDHKLENRAKGGKAF